MLYWGGSVHPRKRSNKGPVNIACNFNAPTGLHNLARGKRERHPGFWRPKVIALKGLHRNGPVFEVAFCNTDFMYPLRTPTG